MSLQGNLQDFDVAEVLQFLCRGKHTGLLTFSSVQDSGRGSAIPTSVSVQLQLGKVVFATSGFRSRLGNRLIEQGLLSRDAMRDLLDKQRLAKSHRPLGALLVDEKLLLPEDLKQQLNAQLIHVVGSAMTWRAGAFSFEKKQVETLAIVGVEQGLSVDTLLLEVHRQQDEAVLKAAAACLRSGDGRSSTSN